MSDRVSTNLLHNLSKTGKNSKGNKSIVTKLNGIDLSLIYNWEAQNHNQYDFKYGDLIKVKWKMDSIWIAGDGETLDFSERAIDADKVKNGNVSNFREIYKKRRFIFSSSPNHLACQLRNA